MTATEALICLELQFHTSSVAQFKIYKNALVAPVYPTMQCFTSTGIYLLRYECTLSFTWKVRLARVALKKGVTDLLGFITLSATRSTVESHRDQSSLSLCKIDNTCASSRKYVRRQLFRFFWNILWIGRVRKTHVFCKIRQKSSPGNVFGQLRNRFLTLVSNSLKVFFQPKKVVINSLIDLFKKWFVKLYRKSFFVTV